MVVIIGQVVRKRNKSKIWWFRHDVEGVVCVVCAYKDSKVSLVMLQCSVIPCLNLSYMFRVLGLFGVMNLHPVDRA